MNLSKLRVGQIGVGGFGRYRRALMGQTGLFELTVVCDWDPETAAKAALEEGASVVPDYAALLHTPGLEAVVICTGAKYHAEQLRLAVDAGLHVFVEKPLCATEDELRALLSAAKRSNSIIVVGHDDHNTESMSTYIKGIIDSGDMGRIATFEATTAHSGGLNLKPGDWRADPEKNPGGMLFQCGVHALHELMYYFGPIASVSCVMRHDVHTSATADIALCHLRFESGIVGTLNAYHVTPYRHTLSIFGTEANLYRNDRFGDEGSTLEVQRRAQGGAKEEVTRLNPPDCEDPTGNLRSFYAAVRSGVEPYPSLYDGARAVFAVFAAETSAKTGQWTSASLPL